MDSPLSEKPLAAVELEEAVAEIGIVGVDDLVAHLYLRAHGVEHRAIRAPQLGLGRCEVGLDGLRLASGNRDLRGLGADSLLDALTALEHDLDEGHRGLGLARVGNGGLQMRGDVAALLGLQLRGGHLNAVLGNVDGVGHDQVDVAAHTGTGVPAGRRDLVVHANGDDILLAHLEIGREIEGEGRVTVRMAAQLLAVDVDGRVHVDAVEVDANLLAGKVVAHLEGFAVPADTARLVGALRLAGLGVILVDAVIMRQVDDIPRGIVERLGVCTRDLAQLELPVLVEPLHALSRIGHAVDVDDLGLGTHLRRRLRTQRGTQPRRDRRHRRSAKRQSAHQRRAQHALRTRTVRSLPGAALGVQCAHATSFYRRPDVDA